MRVSISIPARIARGPAEAEPDRDEADQEKEHWKFPAKYEKTALPPLTETQFLRIKTYQAIPLGNGLEGP